jgi:hypothetical protein
MNVGITNCYVWCHIAGLQHLSDSVPDLPLLKRQDQERPRSRMPDDEEDEREDEQWLRRRPPNHEQRLSREFCLAVVTVLLCSGLLVYWFIYYLLIFLQLVRAHMVLMHLGLIDRPFLPHNLISAQESPVPLPKFQMAPRHKILTLSLPN